MAADQFSLQAGNGAVQNATLTGTLGNKPIRLDLKGEKKLLAEPDTNAWPLSGVIEYADAKLVIDGLLQNAESLSYRGSLQVNTPDINTLAPFAGLAPMPAVRFELKSQIDGHAQMLSLRDLSLQLGDSKFTRNINRAVAADRLQYEGLLKANIADVRELEDIFSDDDDDHWLPVDVDLDISISVDHLKGTYEYLSSIEFTAALNRSKLEVSALSFEFHDNPVHGHFKIDESVAPPGIEVELTANAIDDATLRKLGLNYPGLDISLGKSVLSASAQGRTNPKILEQLSVKFTSETDKVSYSNGRFETEAEVSNLSLSLSPDEPLLLKAEGIHENRPVTISLSVDDPRALMSNRPISISASATSPQASLRVEGDITSPRQADGVTLKIESKGSQIDILHPSLWLPWKHTGPFQFNTTLEHKGNQLTLRDFRAEVDGNDLRGVIVMPTDADGLIDADLKSNSIVIGDVLEPDNDKNEATTPNTKIIPSFPLSSALPRQWNGHFGWQIDRLQLDDSVFGNIAIKGQLNDGNLTLEQTGVTHPDDSPFSILLTIEPNATPPATITVQAEQFDLGWVLPNQFDDQPHWPTDINIPLSGPAETFDQLMAGANGTIELSGGQTQGAEFEKWELNLLSRMIPNFGAKAIDQISCMVVEFDVEDDVAHGDGAVMETQHAVVAGDGTVDLRTEQLDLLLSAQPKNEALLDITASLKVEGSMREPKVEIVSANVAFGPITILRSVTHPISLLQSFFGSQGDNDTTACEAALSAAEKAHEHRTGDNHSS